MNSLPRTILLGGGLEPGFRVLFSAIFHSIAQGNCHQRGKQWKVVEAKLLQNAASLRTFFALVVSAGASEWLVPFPVILERAMPKYRKKNLSFHAVFRGPWLREPFDTSLNCSRKKNEN